MPATSSASVCLTNWWLSRTLLVAVVPKCSSCLNACDHYYEEREKGVSDSAVNAPVSSDGISAGGGNPWLGQDLSNWLGDVPQGFSRSLIQTYSQFLIQDIHSIHSNFQALLSAGVYGCNFKCVWFPSILRLISDLAAASQPCPPIILRESVNRNYGKKHQCDEIRVMR